MKDDDDICRAVVANRNGDGVVLWQGGPDYFREFLNDVSWMLSDVGLDDAPDGISIWEGRVVYTHDAYNGDDDAHLNGKFRDPNDAEWAMIRKNESPWPECSSEEINDLNHD